MRAQKSSITLFISIAVSAAVVIAAVVSVYLEKFPTLQNALGLTSKGSALAINECAMPSTGQNKEIYFVSCGGFF